MAIIATRSYTNQTGNISTTLYTLSLLSNALLQVSIFSLCHEGNFTVNATVTCPTPNSSDDVNGYMNIINYISTGQQEQTNNGTGFLVSSPTGAINLNVNASGSGISYDLYVVVDQLNLL